MCVFPQKNSLAVQNWTVLQEQSPSAYGLFFFKSGRPTSHGHKIIVGHETLESCHVIFYTCQWKLEQHNNNPDPHLMENVMNPVETEVTVHQETIKSRRDWWNSEPSNEHDFPRKILCRSICWYCVTCYCSYKHTNQNVKIFYVCRL